MRPSCSDGSLPVKMEPRWFKILGKSGITDQIGNCLVTEGRPPACSKEKAPAKSERFPVGHHTGWHVHCPSERVPVDLEALYTGLFGSPVQQDAGTRVRRSRYAGSSPPSGTCPVLALWSRLCLSLAAQLLLSPLSLPLPFFFFGLHGSLTFFLPFPLLIVFSFLESCAASIALSISHYRSLIFLPSPHSHSAHQLCFHSRPRPCLAAHTSEPPSRVYTASPSQHNHPRELSVPGLSRAFEKQSSCQKVLPHGFL